MFGISERRDHSYPVHLVSGPMMVMIEMRYVRSEARNPRSTLHAQCHLHPGLVLPAPRVHGDAVDGVGDCQNSLLLDLLRGYLVDHGLLRSVILN